MLEQILEDPLDRVLASNQPLFSTEYDYDFMIEKGDILAKQWGALTPEQKSGYPNQTAFYASQGLDDLKDPKFFSSRNLSLLKKEVKARTERGDTLQMLPLDALDFEDSLHELAESLENIPDLRDIYRIRKLTTGTTKNAGISGEEAKRLKNCFSQGRELFLAGQRGSLMVKPLNFFYALTAYSYGSIVLNNPIVYRKDTIPGSHGMSYLPDTVQARFGGDSARGTFSDLCTSFPTQLVKTGSIEFSIDCTDLVVRFYNERFTVSLGTLMSMIPEMTDYYKLTTNRESRCFPLEIHTVADPRSLTWEFQIGNGETRPPLLGISESFSAFQCSERHGKTIITVPASRASEIKACIYTDMRGKLWYIDNPFYPVILPEIAVHFLVTSLFSNIMRYRPDEWGSVLSNEVKSSISLISRHYFSSFQRKFLITVLRATSRYIPFAVAN